MNDTASPPEAPARSGWEIPTKPLIVTLLIVAALALVFWSGLAYMVDTWGRREEYNHGYLIPIVAFYLLWLRARRLGQLSTTGSWLGVLAVIVGLAGFVLGELSGIYAIIQYAFLLSLFGIVIAAIGWRGLGVAWVPLAYLVFMIPLPTFMLFNLSQELQLISSQIGVAVIRMFGISVFLEGNVIDLGIYQLQVAEACSGLNYLFPLMSFGFLCAVLFDGRWWQRTIIFLSSIPLTIFMNSFRIGVIGVLVENFGIEQAEGFLHYFEGWVVFMACVGLMFVLMWLFSKMNGSRSMLASFGLDVPPVDDLQGVLPRAVNAPVLAAAVMLVAGVVLAQTIQGRVDRVPERVPLSAFPLAVEDWRGRDKVVEQIFIDTLDVDDHLMVDYQRDDSAWPVELWIAYYDQQKKSQSSHSPRTCLPGGGWVIEEFDQVAIPNVGPSDGSQWVNRSVIAKENARQLVYYWFVERGRTVTNEYLVKWYIFWDALTRNRTDGALVRVTTYVPDKAELPAADARLQEFVRSLSPLLAYYLPQDNATFINPDEQTLFGRRGLDNAAP